jgi:hypothetical protein
MIARFLIHLPFALHVEASVLPTMEPMSYDLGDLHIEIFPPYQTSLKPGDLDPFGETPFMELPFRLIPAPQIEIDPNVSINGAPAIRCDGIRVDVHKGSFDRTVEADDPSINLAVALVNDWITRLRLLSRNIKIKTFEPRDVIWNLQYLNDDTTELEIAPPLLRTKRAGFVVMSAFALTGEMWGATRDVPFGFVPSPSDLLLLDSTSSLPDVGPALVLAMTAIETRITAALDILSMLHGIPPYMWKWVSDRGNSLKNPASDEQLDSLLFAITRRSLKTAEPRLWEDFQHLRRARNGFVHAGRAMIGKEEVDASRAAMLIGSADKILDWIEELLPTAYRRPRHVEHVELIYTRTALPPEANAESGEA